MTLADRPTATIPILENGDRLTRYEFERRYHAMPQVKKAELIEGIVYMSSPVRAHKHGKPHANIMGWLFNYYQVTSGIELLDNPTVILDTDNEPQPDACLRIEEMAGGKSRITEADYIEGAPELMVEIAASNASYDLHDKKQVYRRNGIQEYVVWRVQDNAIDWFMLVEGVYIDLPADADGIKRSRVFPGLWLSVVDLLEGNLVQVMKVLNRGLDSLEYREFQHSLTAKLNPQ